MKRIIFTLFLLAGVAAHAQVQTNERVFVLWSVPPAPTTLPANAYYVADYSNAVPVNPTGSWVSFQTAAWTDYLTTNRNGASWTSWATNAANPMFQVQTNATRKYALWYAIYTNLPTGLADSTTRTNSAWIAWNSFKSGTNTAAGTNSLISNALQGQYIQWIYTRQLIDYLNKLGSGLQTIYQPGADPSP